MTIVKTAEAPATTVWALTSIVTTKRSRSRRINRNPASVSARKDGFASSSAGATGSAAAAAAGTRTPITKAVDHRKVQALTRNTTWTSATPSSRAPRAGPTKKARLSKVLEVPLDAVSSSGRLASAGISARWAGRNAPPISEVSVARTKTVAGGRSRARHSAARATRPARMRSAPIITFLRGSRSAMVAATGEANAISARLIAVQMPTACAPPTPYAHTATAVL